MSKRKYNLRIGDTVHNICELTVGVGAQQPPTLYKRIPAYSILFVADITNAGCKDEILHFISADHGYFPCTYHGCFLTVNR